MDFVSEKDYGLWQDMFCRQEAAGEETIGIRRDSEERELSYGRLCGIDKEFGDQILVIKAFTKLYAMAGLRLGYAISRNLEWILAMKNAGPCWNVSVPAQMAGLAALLETQYVEETRRLIEEERGYLMEELQKAGYTVYPSLANFFLLSVEKEAGKQMEETLQQAGLFVRNAENFEGLCEGFYRIAVQTHADNRKLLKILKKGAWGTWQGRS